MRQKVNASANSFIPQQYSWGRLLISHEATCKLLTYLQVFPAFIDTLRAFGERTGFEEDTHSEIAFQGNESSSESVYLIKHAERHGRKELKNPWSIRQMGVYHKVDNKNGDTFLILNPSNSYRRRLKRVPKSSVLEPWEIHMMLLTSAMQNWRGCITSLERDYETMKARTHLSEIVGDDPDIRYHNIRYHDIQDVQVLQDQCLKLCHLLKTNRTILQNIRLPGPQQALDLGLSIPTNGDFASRLAVNVKLQLHRASTLLMRLDGTLGLVGHLTPEKALLRQK
ncbi:hypothetical protein MMC29_001317 [Sticta canariensis]|nr:hypothetical protein [Sticta canariensis]